MARTQITTAVLASNAVESLSEQTCRYKNAAPRETPSPRKLVPRGELSHAHGNSSPGVVMPAHEVCTQPFGRPSPATSPHVDQVARAALDDHALVRTSYAGSSGTHNQGRRPRC